MVKRQAISEKPRFTNDHSYIDNQECERRKDSDVERIRGWCSGMTRAQLVMPVE